ncbi:uncharacterized protein LOC105189693 [Harpegnathos saltator]|uniref:E3 ubiquitin-protein ligase E3D n=1 Tax=Harpegnathos saltator TaxID=610380 RepID=E2C3X0_HARSA|nr:uncharacterized protein LOC105189693 [Harpegnathos saltator]EFN77356.1 hypothetical protein EAI_14487 [Harpegnathos saltator]
MEFITLELRPRLQSCNAFIAMRKDLDLKDVQVKLSESNIALVLKDHNMDFSLPFIKIVPTSLSMLSIRNNWICFRLQMMPLNSVFGSFSVEVLTDSNKSAQLTCSQPILEDIKLLFKASECIVLCACCKNVISKPTTFKRALPLPDIQCSPDEWFCCKHSSNDIVNIETQKSDYLYGSYFALLHKNIFINNLRIDNKTLTCDKCFLHIGALYSCNLLKLWNCCVDYKPQDDTLSIVNATNPLDDFLIFIKDSLTNILGEEIILQTSIGKQTHYLLIKPMDRELNLITEPYHQIINTDAPISLQQKCVAKVLYKYDTSKIANTNNHWNVEYHEVSLPMIEAGLKHLLSSTERLPHNNRNIADYFLGYIALRENVSKVL